MSDTTESQRRLRIWDLPLRVFHWSLVACVAGAFLSIELAEDNPAFMPWHKSFGLAVLSLLLFRLVWGFVGGSHARFSHFVKGPAAILDYLRQFKSHRTPWIGHNPLGALSVLAMLASLLVQAGSGFLMSKWGLLLPIVGESAMHLVRELHEANPGLLVALVALHLAAIAYYAIVRHDNLVHPMLSGKRKIPADLPAEDSQGGSPLLGGLILALAALAVYALYRLL